MISVTIDLRQAERAIAGLAEQVPFASALALTRLAGGVQVAEGEEEKKTFDTPTLFTDRAFAKKPATKADLVASVFIKDQTNAKGGQNAYLEPYVLGGDRDLGGKKGMLVPIGAKKNQYGNLGKNTLARLKANPNVFIGRITFRKGRRAGETVSGVWQRSKVKAGKRNDGEHGTRGDSQGKVKGIRTTLKLLIEFEDTTPVPKRFDFFGRATDFIEKHAVQVFDDAIAEAIKTRKSK